MPKINTIYLINHTHTDIGYTDHQTALLRQHVEYIDRAIELCEATAAEPPEAQFRWTCEVAGIVEQFVRTRPAAQVERLVRLNQAGRIAVTAMGYNWAPLLSPAGMLRSLYPAMRLRRDYNLRISSAMQGDVNGASWLWADLLPAIGVRGMTMSINTHRGRRPWPTANAFWWEGPGGGRLLTFNAAHYSIGVIFWGMGQLGHADAALPAALRELEQRDDYPYDFVYVPATYPNLPDNGPPYPYLTPFVREWNASGREPRIEFTTVDGFLDALHARCGADAPTWRGDWTDWWADGVASSAYETAVARSAEALLPQLDLLAAQTDGLDLALVEQAYATLALYSEHSWGAFNTVTQPHQPFVRAQFNHKAGYAYDGYALTHELLARGGRRLAHAAGLTPEGDVLEAWAPPAETPPTPGDEHYLVINTLGWERRVVCPAPPDGESTAPYHVLDAHFTPNLRDSYPQSVGRPEPVASRPELLSVTLPAFGYRYIRATSGAAGPAQSGAAWLENAWYRLEIDPRTGGLHSWYDKEQGRELAATDGPWRLGQYVYEWVDSPRDRQAIFAEDFSTTAFGRWVDDTPFRREVARQVTLGPTRHTLAEASLDVQLEAPGAHNLRTRYSLPHHQKALHIDLVVDKLYTTRPESVYVIFPFALERPLFHLDLGGVALTPDSEQLPGACRVWYALQRWAEVGDRQTSIVLTPLDAPLVQVGGIQTGRWAAPLAANEATLASWPVQNHWTTNFAAGQSGELLLRYRLTSTDRYDPAAASRFGAEQLSPPIIVRAFGPAADPGQFVDVSPAGVADVQLKRADDGRGLIVRAFNLTAEPQHLALRFPHSTVTQAVQCSPVEEDGDPIALDAGAIPLRLPPRSVGQVRVLLAS